MLGAGLIILSTASFADENLIANNKALAQNNMGQPQVLAAAEQTPTPANQPKIEVQPAITEQQTSTSTTAPATLTNPAVKIETQIQTSSPMPTVPTTAAPVQANQPVTPPKPLDCNFHIPPETTRIEQTVVLKWAEKAATQSFDLDHNLIDKQLTDLKACYTEQGWQSFNDALEKSGNLNAIKTQQLVVSSMPNGEGTINEIKDNQWKVSLPIQVVYQNEKQKLTQPLMIDLVISRKVSGDLGIMQMIAVPKQMNNASKAPAQ